MENYWIIYPHAKIAVQNLVVTQIWAVKVRAIEPAEPIEPTEPKHKAYQFECIVLCNPFAPLKIVFFFG